MTLDEAIDLVAMAAAAFPSYQERDLRPTAVVWHQLLGDLDFEVARAALMKVLATAKYWPTVAEIREAALSLTPTRGVPDPEAAWEEVVQQVRRVGWCGTPRWSHPLVGRAAEALYGSWQALCENLSEDTAAADRAHFLRIYETLARREHEMAALPPAVRQMAEQLGAKMAAGGGALPGGGGKVVPLPRREQGGDR